jgi:precorrin-2 dehydrogenase/sirohydrochlorin ferrochelatase
VELAVYSDDPDLPCAVRRLPGAVDLAGRRVVYVVGLDAVESQRIAERARAAGALVNVEDVPGLCDFHSPSVLRRGDLSIAVSSAGANPSLSKLVVRWLGRTFGPEWSARSDELSRRRTELRKRGLSGAGLFAALDDHVATAGWLER